MTAREKIYDHLTGVLTEMFELAPEQVTPEAHLYDDLDIDSIDAVDLMVELKQWTGKKIQPEEFRTVRTVQDVVESVHKLLNQQSS